MFKRLPAEVARDPNFFCFGVGSNGLGYREGLGLRVERFRVHGLGFRVERFRVRTYLLLQRRLLLVRPYR